MIYIWFPPNSYPNRLVGLYEYETERSPSYLIFSTGSKITNKILTPHCRFTCHRAELLKYDALPDSSGIPLVNQRIRDIFSELCPDDVQYIDAVLECDDGYLEGYQFVNVTHNAYVLDHQHTTYTTLPGYSEILGFTHLAFLPNDMQGHEIARNAEYFQHVLVSEQVRSAFKKNKIKGVSLLSADEFNNIRAKVFRR